MSILREELFAIVVVHWNIRERVLGNHLNDCSGILIDQ